MRLAGVNCGRWLRVVAILLAAGGFSLAAVPSRAAAQLPLAATSALRPSPSPLFAAADPGPAASFATSLALPGLGQYRQGQRRWIVYAALEAATLAFFAHARSEAAGLRRDYRNLAWSAARSPLGAQMRVDGDFDYYERLSHWQASGLWDTDPARAGLQPETDPATWNGSIWRLALEIYNVDATHPEGSPRYDRALDYYRERGYGPLFLWAWSSPADRERYRALIAGSDSRFRDARLAIGLLAANHIVSALDSFISARLSALPKDNGVALALEIALP